MTKPSNARGAILDAFEDILLSDGERAATMDATAAKAGVSKGGLLYHFASKAALESGLIERMLVLGREDVEAMRAAEDGMISAFLRTSVDTGHPLDRAIISVARLAHNGHDEASAAMAELRSLWEEALRPHVRDELALMIVLLVSDGIYFNSSVSRDALGSVPLTENSLSALIERVKEANGP